MFMPVPEVEFHDSCICIRTGVLLKVSDLSHNLLFI